MLLLLERVLLLLLTEDALDDKLLPVLVGPAPPQIKSGASVEMLQVKAREVVQGCRQRRSLWTQHREQQHSTPQDKRQRTGRRLREREGVGCCVLCLNSSSL